MTEILFLAHRAPWPPDRGDRIRSWHMFEALTKLAPVHVAALCDSEAGLAAQQLMAQAGAKSKGCTAVTETGVMWQTIIHMAFIVSAIGIAWTDKLLSQSVAASKKH